jgi:hypothetical protein
LILTVHAQVRYIEQYVDERAVHYEAMNDFEARVSVSYGNLCRRAEEFQVAPNIES